MAQHPHLTLSGVEIVVIDDRFELRDPKGGCQFLTPAESRLFRAFIAAAELPEHGVVNR